MCDLGDGEFHGLIEIIPFYFEGRWLRRRKKYDLQSCVDIRVHLYHAWGQRAWIGVLGCASWLSTLLKFKVFYPQKEKRISSVSVC